MEHPSVFPTLVYHDANAAIDFLIAAFGAERHAVYGKGGAVALPGRGRRAGTSTCRWRMRPELTLVDRFLLVLRRRLGVPDVRAATDV